MVAGARLHHPDPGFPVLELPDGLVLGPWGEIAVDPNTVITDMAMRYGKRSPTHVSTVFRDCADAAAGPVRELPGRSVTLVQRSHGNYGHWIMQGLVRFDVLERTVGFDACDRFLVSSAPPAFLVEVFERNGIDWARAERISNVPGSYRCETLIAPGLPQRAGDSPRWALDRVRDRYGSPPTADAPRRVYLPRGPGARRQVVNEADVIACLERRGFQTVVAPGHTIAEQAAFVAAAECIVAPMGAALANMVFAPRDVHIVELIGANFYTNAYQDVAATLGMPFTRLVGVDPGLPPRAATASRDRRRDDRRHRRARARARRDRVHVRRRIRRITARRIRETRAFTPMGRVLNRNQRRPATNSSGSVIKRTSPTNPTPPGRLLPP